MTAPAVSRRGLRLFTGLVLFAYISVHLANHALGLVSVEFAERGLAMAVRIWHSMPGTVLLYGAFAVHLALAFDAIHARRTLRMAPADLVRIFLGLGIPMLLIGHAVSTRLAWEIYQQSPKYSRVIGSLLAANGQGRQLALLVPGWLHGCIGIHFAFSRRPAYRRLRPLLFAIALLLPVLGALGFLAMAKELAIVSARPGQGVAGLDLARGRDAVLLDVREAVLAVYVAACAMLFLARAARSWQERRMNALVCIRYPGRTVRVPRGWSVLEASRSHHVPHLSVCGGRARCSTCRVRIVAGEQNCPPPNDAEANTLKRIRAVPGVRLACQLRPVGDISVAPVLATGRRQVGAEFPVSAIEQNLALVCVDWRNFPAVSSALLPQDEVFLCDRFHDTVLTLVLARHGVVCNSGSDTLTALFGIAGDLPQACRDALSATRALELALSELAEVCSRQFGMQADFVFHVHVGLVALSGAEPDPAHRLIAAGPAIQAVKKMRSASIRRTSGAIVSLDVLLRAGADRLRLEGLDDSLIEGADRLRAVDMVSMRGIDALLDK